jgi:hypothetical protein
MQIRPWRTTLLAAAAVFPAVVLFAGYLALQLRLGDGAGLWLLVLHAVVFLFLASALAAVLCLLLRRQHLRALARLSEQVTQLRTNPSAHFPPRGASDRVGREEMAPVLAEVRVLADCYRKALAELVHAREEVENLSGNGQSVKSSQLARRPGTSSRQRMVARLAPNLHWLAATPPLLQFLRCTLKDVLARPFADSVHPGDLAAVRRSLSEALRDGEAHNITFRIYVPFDPSLAGAAAAVVAAKAGRPPAVKAHERHLQRGRRRAAAALSLS